MNEQSHRASGMSSEQYRQMIDDLMLYHEVKFQNPLNADTHVNAFTIDRLTHEHVLNCENLDTIDILLTVAMVLKKSQDPKDLEQATLYEEIATHLQEYEMFIQLLPSSSQ